MEEEREPATARPGAAAQEQHARLRDARERQDPAAEPSRAERASIDRGAVNAHAASMRAQAVRATGGPVRGPRVTSTAGAFTLTYRGAGRCTVRLRVDRSASRTVWTDAPRAVRGCR